jgi:hypothetical protein
MSKLDFSTGLSAKEIGVIKYNIKNEISRKLPKLPDPIETRLFLQGRDAWVFGWNLLNKNVPLVSDTLKSTEEKIINISNDSSADVNLTPEEEESLFSRLSDDVHKLVTKSVVENVAEKQKSKIQHDDVLNFASELRDRLVRESERLSSRANTNLFIASVTSIIGIAFLGFVLVGGASYDIELSEQGLSIQLAEYALYYLPRLTLVIIIEIFSYFFLRLYKTTLEDIKYYQNELTNIDSNISALRLSLLLNDSEVINKVSTKLLDTSETSFLRKGIQQYSWKLHGQKLRNLLKH